MTRFERARKMLSHTLYPAYRSWRRERLSYACCDTHDAEMFEAFREGHARGSSLPALPTFKPEPEEWR
jgi:hypothetical protein